MSVPSTQSPSARMRKQRSFSSSGKMGSVCSIRITGSLSCSSFASTPSIWYLKRNAACRSSISSTGCISCRSVMTTAMMRRTAMRVRSIRRLLFVMSTSKRLMAYTGPSASTSTSRVRRYMSKALNATRIGMLKAGRARLPTMRTSRRRRMILIAKESKPTFARRINIVIWTTILLLSFPSGLTPITSLKPCGISSVLLAIAAMMKALSGSGGYSLSPTISQKVSAVLSTS
mmetsp:Transcript_26857/g.88131  ORF Transcript_26857/g.88131 Transcript_26857/m.88131 type:complete len:231 (-) Transcript_26857:1461-2153(-)